MSNGASIWNIVSLHPADTFGQGKTTHYVVGGDRQMPDLKAGFKVYSSDRGYDPPPSFLSNVGASRLDSFHNSVGPEHFSFLQDSDANNFGNGAVVGLPLMHKIRVQSDGVPVQSMVDDLGSRIISRRGIVDQWPFFVPSSATGVGGGGGGGSTVEDNDPRQGQPAPGGSAQVSVQATRSDGGQPAQAISSPQRGQAQSSYRGQPSSNASKKVMGSRQPESLKTKQPIGVDEKEEETAQEQQQQVRYPSEFDEKSERENKDGDDHDIQMRVRDTRERFSHLMEQHAQSILGVETRENFRNYVDMGFWGPYQFGETEVEHKTIMEEVMKTLNIVSDDDGKEIDINEVSTRIGELFYFLAVTQGEESVWSKLYDRLQGKEGKTFGEDRSFVSLPIALTLANILINTAEEEDKTLSNEKRLTMRAERQQNIQQAVQKWGEKQDKKIVDVSKTTLKKKKEQAKVDIAVTKEVIKKPLVESVSKRILNPEESKETKALQEIAKTRAGKKSVVSGDEEKQLPQKLPKAKPVETKPPTKITSFSDLKQPEGRDNWNEERLLNTAERILASRDVPSEEVATFIRMASAVKSAEEVRDRTLFSRLMSDTEFESLSKRIGAGDQGVTSDETRKYVLNALVRNGQTNSQGDRTPVSNLLLSDDAYTQLAVKISEGKSSDDETREFRMNQMARKNIAKQRLEQESARVRMNPATHLQADLDSSLLQGVRVSNDDISRSLAQFAHAVPNSELGRVGEIEVIRQAANSILPVQLPPEPEISRSDLARLVAEEVVNTRRNVELMNDTLVNESNRLQQERNTMLEQDVVDLNAILGNLTQQQSSARSTFENEMRKLQAARETMIQQDADSRRALLEAIQAGSSIREVEIRAERATLARESERIQEESRRLVEQINAVKQSTSSEIDQMNIRLQELENQNRQLSAELSQVNDVRYATLNSIQAELSQVQTSYAQGVDALTNAQQSLQEQTTPYYLPEERQAYKAKMADLQRRYAVQMHNKAQESGTYNLEGLANVTRDAAIEYLQKSFGNDSQFTRKYEDVVNEAIEDQLRRMDYDDGDVKEVHVDSFGVITGSINKTMRNEIIPFYEKQERTNRQRRNDIIVHNAAQQASGISASRLRNDLYQALVAKVSTDTTVNQSRARQTIGGDLEDIFQHVGVNNFNSELSVDQVGFISHATNQLNYVREEEAIPTRNDQEVSYNFSPEFPMDIDGDVVMNTSDFEFKSPSGIDENPQAVTRKPFQLASSGSGPTYQEYASEIKQYEEESAPFRLGAKGVGDFSMVEAQPVVGGTFSLPEEENSKTFSPNPIVGGEFFIGDVDDSFSGVGNF